MVMMKAGRGRACTEAVRVPAVVTFSTCSAALEPPSRLLCAERSRHAFLHGRPGVRHPTNPRLRLSAVRLHARETELSTDPTRARQRWLGS